MDTYQQLIEEAQNLNNLSNPETISSIIERAQNLGDSHAIIITGIIAKKTKIPKQALNRILSIAKRNKQLAEKLTEFSEIQAKVKNAIDFYQSSFKTEDIMAYSKIKNHDKSQVISALKEFGFVCKPRWDAAIGQTVRDWQIPLDTSA